MGEPAPHARRGALRLECSARAVLGTRRSSQAVLPPSTAYSAPVTKLAAGEARNATNGAISPGTAGLPSTVVAPKAWIRSAGTASVPTGPGATVLTRTPAGLNSAAQVRVIAANAAFVAL